MTYLAVATLFLGVAFLAVIGGAAFALLLFFPLFQLALLGVLAAVPDRTVRQHNPTLDARGWRHGS
jgi:hypothetical protein